MLSYQYGKSHCGDKTIIRSSYLHNGNSYTGKTTSLYWITALGNYFFSTENSLQWLPRIVMVSQITSNLTVYSTAFSKWQQRKHKLFLYYWLFVRGIHQWFPSQRASNVECISMPLHLHDNIAAHRITHPCEQLCSTDFKLGDESEAISDVLMVM